MDNNKKRNWIKNAAIIFLAIMLLLTLFSGTITKFTLPQVSTAYVDSKEVTSTIRGSGTVEAGTEYTPTAAETRNITSVMVSKGDHVEAGDVIYTLEDVESTELKTAISDLDKLKESYYTKLFSDGATNEMITRARTDNFSSDAQKQQKVAELEKRIEDAQVYYNDCLNQYYVETILASIADADITRLSEVETEALLEAEVNKLSFDLSDMEKSDLDNERNKIYIEAKKRLEDAKAAATIASEANTYQKQQNDLPMTNAKTLMDTAKANLDDLGREKEELLKELNLEILVEEYDDQILRKEEEIEALKAKAYGASITAEMSGTVQMVISSGKIESGKELYTILPDGENLRCKISVPNKDASMVKVGQSGEITEAYYYSNPSAVLEKISDDTESNGTKSLLTFVLGGDGFKVGQNLTISIGTSTKKYDVVVPKGAIKHDQSGDFVYRVEVKSSALGNRYIARKVSVRELASDEKSAAVEISGGGMLSAGDYVITTMDTIVEADKEVRLSTSNNG